MDADHFKRGIDITVSTFLKNEPTVGLRPSAIRYLPLLMIRVYRCDSTVYQSAYPTWYVYK